MTPGGKPIMFFAILALVEEGDEVHLPEPGLPDLRVDDPLRRRRSPCRCRCARRSGFALDVDELDRSVTPKTRLVILNSPQNPTGGVMPEADAAAHRRDLRVQHGILVLSDEIYSRILYEGEHVVDRCHARDARAHDHPRRLLARRTR